jgi:HSP20 family molecular chaperone IbpA
MVTKHVDVQKEDHTMPTNGTSHIAVRRPLFPELDRSERTYGHIIRALALPEGCNADGAAATVKDGVLEVVVPRKATAKSKKVAVTAA